MKVKLHSVIRLRKRIIAILDQFGREALIGTLRSHLEDTETEMRRRIREMPDGTTRVLQFLGSSLRANAMETLYPASPEMQREWGREVVGPYEYKSGVAGSR